MNTFTIEAALRYGWETFKKRAGFFIGLTFIIGLISWVVGFVMAMLVGEDSPIGGIVSLLVSTLVDLGVVSILLKTFNAAEAPSFNDLWHPQGYLPYLGATVLMGIAVVVGLILLIIPGIIAILMFMFVKFIVVDRNLGPIEAMKESARITKGHRFTLFLFLLSIVLLNILGTLALVVGLLVTIPISGLAMVYAYKTLGHAASEATPVSAPTPAPQV